MLELFDAFSDGNLVAEGFVKAILRWREPLLVLFLAAECMPFIGLAAPGLIVLTLAGFAATLLGPVDAIRLYCTAIATVFLIDYLMFSLGQFSQTRIGLIRRMVGSNTALGIELMQQPFYVLLLYQFPAYSRMFAPLLLGSTAMPTKLWLKVSSLGTILFVTCFFGIGATAGILRRNADTSASLATVIAALSAVGLFYWLARTLWRLWKRRGLSK
jgi:membrane protein DedA with SNARE-associated domain